jgi:hypothetical protein
MEVPCCGGLLQLVWQAVAKANRKISVKKIVIRKDIFKEEWIY